MLRGAYLVLLLFPCMAWSSAQSENCEQPQALSRCVKPAFPAEYYIEQSVKYFRTMESSVSPSVQPEYSEQVIRWEWEPWLLLTGYGRWNLIWTDTLLKLFPTSYDILDCRFFDTQPFGRCRVVFNYGGRLCPIYEEFTFNHKGEMTFIEAWTDYEQWLPMPIEDVWAEGEQVKRLSTKVPGLGNEEGLIDKHASWMALVAENDEDVRDLLRRLHKPYRTYFEELFSHEGDVLKGCDQPE